LAQVGGPPFGAQAPETVRRCPDSAMGLVKDLICCWPKLIYGQACIVWNCLFSPCILSGWACSIYVCGCCQVYFNRSFYKFCCCCCRALNCCWLYTDKEFPPNDTSLGNIGGDTANEASGKSDVSIKWLRANLFDKTGKMQLFSGTIDSRDICQGALGDCWLLAAMACLAEHKGAINSIFYSKEKNPRGKYKLRLYDGVKEKWQTVTIDDFIPCDRRAYERDGTCRAIFTQPNGNELYVMLLEKAFAKFCGSFANMEGGMTIWAIRAMTGDPARLFIQDDDGEGWKRYDLVNKEDDENRRAAALKPRGETQSHETMFEILRKYHSLKSVLSASGSSGKDGLHKGHAYSILDVRKVNTGYLGIGGDTFRLIKIRNPWGNGEWEGDWSDKSPLWEKHTSVKKAVDYSNVDDGAFWMSWEDYVRNWKMIGVVDRTVDIRSLKLHVASDSACAPVKGCCAGCLRFWCCCEGPRLLYRPHHSSDETVKVNKGCCMIL